MSTFVRVALVASVGFAVLVGSVVGYREWNSWQAESVAKRDSARITEEGHGRREAMQNAKQKMFADIRAADKVADKLQRCLKFPSPPSIHWNNELVADLCRLDALELVSIEEIAAKLSQGNVAAVDGIFDQYAEQNVSEPSKHGILMRAFETRFDSNNPDVGAVVDSWVKQAPRSANALAARGIFRVRNGYEARGGDSSGETPAENFKEMRRLLDLGISDLESSLRINPRFAVPATYLVYAHRSEGKQATTAAAGKKAVELDPTEYRTYIFWLTAAAPNWGGSIENLHEIVETSKPYAARNPLLALVNARAMLLERRALNGGLSQSEYMDVLAIAPDEWALKEVGMTTQSDDIILVVSQLIRFQPNVTNYMTRSEQLFLLRQPDWSKQDAEQAAEMATPLTANLTDAARAFRTAGKK